MAEKQEKSSEKGFLARTASITTKRAKRAQEKVEKSFCNFKILISAEVCFLV